MIVLQLFLPGYSLLHAETEIQIADIFPDPDSFEVDYDYVSEQIKRLADLEMILDNDEKLEMYLQISSMYHSVNSLDSALQYYMKSLHLLSGKNDYRAVARLLYLVSDVLNKQNIPQKAIWALDSLQNLLVANGYWNETIRCLYYLQLSVVAEKQQDYLSARKYVYDALKCKDLSDEYKARARHRLAYLLHEQGLYKEIIILFGKGGQFIPDSPDIQYWLGIAYLDSKKIAEAKPYLREALQKYKKEDNVKGIGRTYNAFITIYNAESKPDSVYYATRQAIINCDSAHHRRDAEILNQIEVEHNSKRLMDDYRKTLDEEQYQKKTNTILTILIIVLVIIFAGLAVSLILYRRQHKNLLATTESLKKTNTQLVASNKEKDLIFSIIGHDVRTPLTIITSSIGLLRDASVNMQKKPIIRHARKIAYAAEMTDFMLSNILAWSKVKLNMLSPNKVMFKLEYILNRNLEMARDLVFDKDIEIISRIGSNIEVESDPNMIETIVRNLVVNAIKFTDKGSITIDAVRQNEAWIISVEDTGVGIAPGNIDKIYNIDFTKIGTKNEKGHGIGLKLCQEFVHALGGRIFAESQLDVGTKISFTLPDSK